MKTRIVFGFGIAVTCVTLLSGCVIALGNRDLPSDHKATLGKQLTDLKQARDSGAITEDEYQTAKKRLIESK
ncbi:MAG TPA: SHOCT domain-containing protein [Verrucomicrobiae bacterium]|jgi:hypothetical protein